MQIEKVKKCEYGEIVYRKPKITELMRLLGKSGNNINDEGQIVTPDNKLVWMSDNIDSLKDFIVRVDLDVNGEKIKTFDEMLYCFELTGVIGEIATEFNGYIDSGEAKKKSSKKQQASG